MDDFMKAVDRKVEEYHKEYLPELERIVELRANQKQKEAQKSLSRLEEDLAVDARTGEPPINEPVYINTVSDEEEEFEDNGAEESDFEVEEADEDDYTVKNDKGLQKQFQEYQVQKERMN